MGWAAACRRAACRAAGGVLAAALLPAAAAKVFFDPKLKGSAAERLALGQWRNLPAHDFWFHAASMGEVEGVAPVVGALPEIKSRLLITTTSRTGREAVLKKKLCEHALLLPYDHPSIVKKALSKAQPKLFVLFETEIWPNLLFALQKCKIPVIVVNGRISDYSYPRYLKLRWFLGEVLKGVEHCFVQSELDAERFSNIGMPRVEVIGSTKYDQQTSVTEQEKSGFKQALGLLPDAPCFVAGSVRPGEDRVVLDAYRDARASVPGLQLVFVPRHPEKFEEAAQLLQSYGFEFNRRSAGPAQTEKPVLLLDTLGELRKAYSLAAVSFVGGTLVDIGGHNPFEPAMYGCPVLMGPYTNNVKDAVAQLRRAGGLFDAADAPAMAKVLTELCLSEDKRLAAGKGAQDAWRKNLGATGRVSAEIQRYVRV